MRYSFDCPYLNDTKHDAILCELARIKPPDNEARVEFLAQYCGHATDYKECPFYKILDNYYKRKYSTEVAKW